MEIRPFKELIAMSAEKLNEAMAPIRAKQVKSKAQLEMSHLESELLNIQTKIQEHCTQKDINLPAILDLIDDAAVLEHRLEKYSELLDKLFPEDAKAA